MIKVEIVLDEDRLSTKYPIEKVWAAIDSAFVGHGIYKDSKGIYKGSGLSTDFAYFGIGISLLAKQNWFMENVKSWLWYNSDMSASEEDFNVENLRENFHNYYMRHRNK